MDRHCIYSDEGCREMVLVMNRELVDYTRDRTFTSVTGDVTFKFNHTFRF